MTPTNKANENKTKRPARKKSGTQKPIKLKKALTVANIQNQKVERLPFAGKWYQAFRKPQTKGVWFVWGDSGSGKSSFLMQLAKEFAKTEKTVYNLLEEEPDDSDYIERTELFMMNEVADNFLTVSYTYEELVAYLEKKGSPKRVFIDSITYFTKKWEEYLELKRRFPDKIFVISGHADGKKPRAKIEEDIMYDAKMKIFIEGYLASCKGRTIGPNGGQFITYEEGYHKLRGAAQNT